ARRAEGELDVAAAEEGVEIGAGHLDLARVAGGAEAGGGRDPEAALDGAFDHHLAPGGAPSARRLIVARGEKRLARHREALVAGGEGPEGGEDGLARAAQDDATLRLRDLGGGALAEKGDEHVLAVALEADLPHRTPPPVLEQRDRFGRHDRAGILARDERGEREGEVAEQGAGTEIVEPH